MFKTGQRGTNNNKFSPDRIPKAQINKHPANTDKKSFMFFRLPSDSFYHAIDSLTLIKESGWSKDSNNKYTYQMVWDAKDSPNGDDLFLTIEIEKGSRFGHMRFGAW